MTMKTIIYFALLLFFISCGSNENDTTANAPQTFSNSDEIVNSIKGDNGKYTVDNMTREYLHRLENSVINFRDMAKKRKPGINIYKEFSEILNREVTNLNTNSAIKGEGKERLQNILEKILEQNKNIAGNDLEQAKSAFQQVCDLTLQLNSGFDYNN